MGSLRAADRGELEVEGTGLSSSRYGGAAAVATQTLVSKVGSLLVEERNMDPNELEAEAIESLQPDLRLLCGELDLPPLSVLDRGMEKGFLWVVDDDGSSLSVDRARDRRPLYVAE